jgi:hypothetical protein
MNAQAAGAADVAGSVLFETSKQLLQDEYSRKSSLESRSTSVITTSGTVVTLVFALAALVTKPSAFVLPALAVAALVFALVFFCIAIGAAVFVFAPSSDYRALSLIAFEAGRSIEDMSVAERITASQAFVRDKWTKDSTGAQIGLTESAVERLERARDANDRKAGYLGIATTFEVAALVALAGSVLVVLVMPLIEGR